jgi:hypothetical protein
MTSYIRDPRPDAGPGWYVSDETPIPRHPSTDSLLYSFMFDGDNLPRLDCPDDCGTFCEPASVGEAVDWALGHKCSLAEDTP